jgi:hypothetical protein
VYLPWAKGENINKKVNMNPVTWTQDSPSVIAFNGTNGADAYKLTFTRQGAGPAYTAAFLKNGSSAGSLSFDNLQIAQSLFEVAAPALS